MFEYDKSKNNREQLKRFVLEHSLNQMNDMVRLGRIGPDEHAMAVEVWEHSKMDWDKVPSSIHARVTLGFLTLPEAELALSVLAEICPSRFD